MLRMVKSNEKLSENVIASCLLSKGTSSACTNLPAFLTFSPNYLKSRKSVFFFRSNRIKAV